MALHQQEPKRYLTIIGSTGKFHEVVDETTEGAIRREYETSDGKHGEKWELRYNAIDGKIKDVNLREGDYGTQLFIQMEVEGEDDDITVIVSTNSPFGETILKRLPNIDFEKEVTLKPYRFRDENENLKRGVSVKQDEQKIQDFFFDPEKKKPTNGAPEPKGDVSKYTKEKWKLHFAQVNNFLLDYTKSNILPQFGHTEEEEIKSGDEF